MVAIYKVSAHESVLQAASAMDEWLTVGNNGVDRLVKAANLQCPPGVWKLWERLVTEKFQQAQATLAIHQLIVDVGELWNDRDTPAPIVQVETPATRVTREFQTKWESDGQFTLKGNSFRKFFGDTMIDKVRSWCVRVLDPAQPVRWVSYIQLYMSFQSLVGPIAVLKRQGKWEIRFGVEAVLQSHLRFLDKVKYFRLIFQQFLKNCCVVFATATTRPHSEWVACHRGCISIPLSDDNWMEVERILATQLRTPCNGQGKPLQFLKDP